GISLSGGEISRPQQRSPHEPLWSRTSCADGRKWNGIGDRTTSNGRFRKSGALEGALHALRWTGDPHFVRTHTLSRGRGRLAAIGVVARTPVGSSCVGACNRRRRESREPIGSLGEAQGQR